MTFPLSKRGIPGRIEDHTGRASAGRLAASCAFSVDRVFAVIVADVDNRLKAVRHKSSQLI
jgi:hypothetical protein